MREIALKVEGLTKEYRLGSIGYGTMREDLQSWWANIRGKDDPNSLISSNHNDISEKKHFLALDDINFEIHKGDRIGVIGHNGAGKSTLLKILSRITSPTKGNIYINGRIGSLLEVGTGFHRELTGRENIYLNGTIMGMNRNEINKKIDEIIEFSGVEKFIDTPVKRYSSGMFVRLGFAVAAHLEPEILIVDEVLAVGDLDFQKKAIGKMEEVSSNDGRTVIFVSHNMESVRKLCNKGILLDKGRVIKKGLIDDIVDDYVNKDDLLYHNPNIRKEFSRSFGPNISCLTVYSEKGLLNDSINAGETVKIKMDLEYSELWNRDFGILVYIINSRGLRIAASSTMLMNDIVYKDEKVIDFDIDTRVLVPGKYTVSVQLHNHYTGEVFDNWQNCIRFKIRNHDLNGTGYNYGTHWSPLCYVDFRYNK